MSLSVGTRLGPYEILSAIGAIKVLPDSFASDTERVARFTREAQTLASLNHPHIG
jgi:serine/threonine protein kinase